MVGVTTFYGFAQLCWGYLLDQSTKSLIYRHFCHEITETQTRKRRDTLINSILTYVLLAHSLVKSVSDIQKTLERSGLRLLGEGGDIDLAVYLAIADKVIRINPVSTLPPPATLLCILMQEMTLKEEFFDKKERGVFFTPFLLAKKMVEEVDNVFLEKNKDLTSLKILEPSVGTGVFLKSLLESFAAQFRDVRDERQSLRKFLSHIIANNIYAVELNSELAEVCRWTVLLTYYQLTGEVKRLGMKVLNEDFLRAEFGSFDLIIGNPPFARTPPRGTPVSKELAVQFLNKSLTHLRPSGMIYFILPSSVLTTIEMEENRRYWATEFRLVRLEDYGLSKFRHVDSETCLVLLENTKPMLTHETLCVTSEGVPEANDVLPNPLKHHIHQTKFTMLYTCMYNLGMVAKDYLLLAKLRMVATPLVEAGFEVRRGVELGKSNPLFLPVETQLTTPVLTAEDLFQNMKTEPKLFLIHTESTETKPKLIYSRPKITIHGVKKMRYRHRLVGAMDTSAMLTLSSCHMIYEMKDDVRRLSLLECFLNSDLANYLYYKLYPTTRIKKSYLTRFPVLYNFGGENEDVLTQLSHLREKSKETFSIPIFLELVRSSKDIKALRGLLDQLMGELIALQDEFLRRINMLIYRAVGVEPEVQKHISVFLEGGKVVNLRKSLSRNHKAFVTSWMYRLVLRELRRKLTRDGHTKKVSYITEMLLESLHHYLGESYSSKGKVILEYVQWGTKQERIVEDLKQRIQ